MLLHLAVTGICFFTFTNPLPEIIPQHPQSKLLLDVGVATVVGISSTVQRFETPPTDTPETGTINSSLDYRGHPNIPPFPTPVISSIPLPPASAAVNTSPANAGISTADPFTPIGSNPPPGMFTRRGDHPFRRESISDQAVPADTNKFYANLFLGNQESAVYTQPYSLRWNKDPENWGITISHIESSQLAYGPEIGPNRVKYYINPVGINYMTFSACEFSPSLSAMTLDDTTAFSVSVNLLADPSVPQTRRITFPLCQGMGFVTGLYDNLTPVFGSGVLFRSVSRVPTSRPRRGITKYRLTLEDGRVWILYATATTSSFNTPTDAALELRVVSNRRIEATGLFTGIVQIAKLPVDEGSNPAAAEDLYDGAAGLYCKGMHVSAGLDDRAETAKYSFGYTKGGVDAGVQLFSWALPHHVDSMDSSMGGIRRDVRLRSTTKGVMTAVVADRWVMVEQDLPTNIGFFPWKGVRSGGYSPGALSVIAGAAWAETQQDMDEQSNLNSMYFSGKALSKFAMVCFVAKEITRDAALANTCIKKLKHAFRRFARCQQIYPLVYDTIWKGLVSDAIYITKDPGQDFGNGAYNDHHFHYGYHVHTAAVLSYLDPSFLTPEIRDYTNSLVRDYANPSSNDPYFPFMRSFDFFNGHSWAKGLFASADGKDQESTSEDYNAMYAIKLWGDVSGQPGLTALATIALAVEKRSMQSYFLMESGNVNQPARFVGNKVTGILFENKADYTTYFGNNPEYIHGIHMIPLMPMSPYVRSTKFVNEELEMMGGDGFINTVVGGWRGILVANKAIVRPREAWDFFAQPGFDWGWLDGGASRTWYLAWTGWLAGA